jgi:hypothetical protein
MKKTLLVLAFVAAASAAFAQVNMTNKRGENILPEAGNWAIGIDAWPFVHYAGQLLNGSTGPNSVYFSSPVMGFDSEVILYGKKVKDATTHYRGKLRIGFGSDKIELPTTLDTATGGSFIIPQYGNDEYKMSGNGITIGGGIEKRLGQGRLQGYYGPEICIGFGSTKATHTYANAITEDNQSPTISGLWGSYGTPSYPYLGSGRITETKFGSNFMFHLRAFAGVEFFYMAKASIGAEFGWGVMMMSSGATEVSTEQWGHPAGDNVFYTQTVETKGKQSSFHLDTDVDGGNGSTYASLRMLWYF